MLCPRCRIEMQLLCREPSDKGVTEKYKCRNKRCPAYDKEIKREIQI